ncbi:MAG: hypothetical protein HYS09_03285 [Chloroflexi bacterium]|nr:hypothetical protein [Chloroflexota bacterium]
MAVRGETGELIHARAVQDIAKARYAFPTPRYPHYKTYVNHPQRTMAVRTFDNRALFPDIVVVLDPENYAKLLGEVETAETVNGDEAREWKVFSELGPLYLYVPVGHAEEAKKLCKQVKAQVVGIRTWRYVVGYEEVEINDYFTQWVGVEDLLPKPIGDRLRPFVPGKRD